MSEDRVRQPDVAFTVFKVNRVNLVRHGRGADLALDGLLPEIAHGNVGPHVAVKIEQDVVPPRHGVKQLGHVVVRFDLRGQRILRQSQFVFDHAPRQCRPVHVRVGREVCIVVADGAIHLALDHHGADAFGLPAQAPDKDGKLLANRGRRRGLPMRARQHGNRTVCLCHSLKGIRDGVLAGRQGHDTILEHEGVRQVVDVLRGAGKMNEFQQVGD